MDLLVITIVIRKIGVVVDVFHGGGALTSGTTMSCDITVWYDILGVGGHHSFLPTLDPEVFD